jgi:hypothetical protein
MSIAASSANCERIFSVSEQTQRPLRNRIKANTMEQITTLGQWLADELKTIKSEKKAEKRRKLTMRFAYLDLKNEMVSGVGELIADDGDEDEAGAGDDRAALVAGGDA